MKHKISKVLFVVAIILIVCLLAVGCDDNQNKGPQKYTVTYVLGDGVEGTAPTLANQTAGATFKVAAATGLTKDGFTFGGWSYKGQTYQADGDFTMPAENVTFTAIWNANQQPPVTYAVTYNINGAEGTAPTLANQAEGATFQVAAATGLTKDGFTFGGWSFDDHTYQANDTFTMPAKAVEFVAIWNANQQPTVTYAVTYNINGAEGTAPTLANQAEGATFQVAAATGLTKEGFTFGGWSFDGHTYQANDTFTMPAKAVEFVAIWNANQPPQPQTHTVTFKPNNGSQNWTVQVESGQKVSKPATDPVGENNAVFRYWSNEEGEYNFNTSVTEDLELEAVYGWRVSYEIGTGATGSIQSQVVRKGERITLPDNTGLSNGDKVFGGWTVKNGDETVYSADDFYLVNANVTFVAVWNDPAPVGEYTVSFATQFRGEGTPPASITGQHTGDKITLPENPFTVKESSIGYVFVGWYAGTNQDVLYQPGDEYTIQNADVKFTAKWAQGKFTITYKAGEHSTGADYIVQNVNGGVIDLLDDLTGHFTVESDYTFIGWKIEGSQDNATYMYNYPLGQNTVFVAYCSKIFNAYDNSGNASISIDLLGGYGVFATYDRDGEPVAIENISFVLDGENATVTIGTTPFTGTFVDNDLEITITYDGTNYVFGFSTAQKYSVTVIKSSNDSIINEISGEIPTIEDKAQGEQFTIPANTFTRPHYTLTGWRVQVLNIDDPSYSYWETVANYGVNESIVMQGSVIRIEPTWTANQVTVTFNANGGSGTMESKQYAADTSFSYNGTKFQCDFTAPEGMKFDYWATSANGTKIENGTKLLAIAEADDTLTLYAVWKSTTPVAFVNPVIAIEGNWTATGHTLTVSAIPDVTAEQASQGKALGNAVLDGLVCHFITNSGVLYLVSNYSYDISYSVEVGDTSLLFTNYDESTITFSDKTALSVSPIADFVGKWSKPLPNNQSQNWIITEDKASYGTSFAEASHKIVGNYIVIEFEQAGTPRAYVLNKDTNSLVGYYCSDPEKAPEQVTFEQGDYIVLYVDGVPNQIVTSGSAPDSSKVSTPTAPEGQTFLKWVIADTETEFNFADAMTEDVFITAVFEAAAFTGKTYTGYCTTPVILGRGGQTFVKFEIDFDNNTLTYYLSDNTSKSISMSDNSNSNWKPDNYGTDALYFEVTMENVSYYILVKADKTKIYICDSDDNPLTNGEFTEKTEGGDDEPQYELVALSDLAGKTFNTSDGNAFYSTYKTATVSWNTQAKKYVVKFTPAGYAGHSYNIEASVENQSFAATVFKAERNGSPSTLVDIGFEKDSNDKYVLVITKIYKSDAEDTNLISEPVRLYEA